MRGNDYTYLGYVKGGQLVRRGKIKVSPNAPSSKAMAWLWPFVEQAQTPKQAEIWHSDKCARCGRKLTVPESIGRGLGPICAGKVKRK